ncbi:hypothetical protein AKUA2003_12430 [Apilactobacillus kunkeei]|nr:hypothetical protein AKUA1001_12460 [Apilactobacillus kunkeei]CAI2649055.1 hypothetical protein AKUA2003_12430 [Apilactobacillus kunkeei]CAI2803190.1 hypothetical protein AKUA2002_12450 [Apilactobacillus kunkeei]
MFRHAYLIIANKNFEQLKLLVSLLDDYRNDIYLMIDKKSKIVKEDRIRTVNSNIYYLDPINIYWGEYSGIQAELNLFRAASKKKYAYYHLISGQDLPLASQNVIHDFFKKNYGNEFVAFQHSSIDEIKDKVKPHLLRKYYNDGIRNKNSSLNIFLRLLVSIYRHLESIFLKKLFNNINFSNMKVGPNWVSITHDTVMLILNNESRIFKMFGKGKVIDEMFIQTILNENHYFMKKVSDSREYKYSPNSPRSNLRYVVKKFDDPHPKIFSKSDFKELMHAKKEGYLFARKFDIKKDKEIIHIICDNIQE